MSIEYLHEPDTVLSVVAHVLLTITLQGRCHYYPIFIDKETESQRKWKSHEATQLMVGLKLPL